MVSKEKQDEIISWFDKIIDDTEEIIDEYLDNKGKKRFKSFEKLDKKEKLLYKAVLNSLVDKKIKSILND